MGVAGQQPADVFFTFPRMTRPPFAGMGTPGRRRTSRCPFPGSPSFSCFCSVSRCRSVPASAQGYRQPRRAEHRAAGGRAVSRSRRVAGPVGGAGLAAARAGHLHLAGPSAVPLALSGRGQPEPGGERAEHLLLGPRAGAEAVVGRGGGDRRFRHARLRLVQLDRRRGLSEQRGVPARLHGARSSSCRGSSCGRRSACPATPCPTEADSLRFNERAAARAADDHRRQVLGVGHLRRQPLRPRRADAVPELGAGGRGRLRLRGGCARLDLWRRGGVGEHRLGRARRRVPGGAAGERAVHGPGRDAGVAAHRAGGPVLRDRRAAGRGAGASTARRARGNPPGASCSPTASRPSTRTRPATA